METIVIALVAFIAGVILSPVVKKYVSGLLNL